MAKTEKEEQPVRKIKHRSPLRKLIAAEESLVPCPFCKDLPRIGVHDDEGNFKGFAEDDRAREYLDDTWSGLSFRLWHPSKCPVGTDDPHRSMGFGGYNFQYPTAEAAAEHWNKRAGK